MDPEDQLLLIITTILRPAVAAGMSTAEAFGIYDSLMKRFAILQSQRPEFTADFLASIQLSIARIRGVDSNLDGIVQSVVLAITAPSEEKANDAWKLAEFFAARLPVTDLVNAKRATGAFLASGRFSRKNRGGVSDGEDAKQAGFN